MVRKNGGSGLNSGWTFEKINISFKVIIAIVNNAMVKLKTYPRNGKLYYKILTNTYFVTNKYSESQLLEILDISRTTYYRQKKKAICLFGVILWGYVIPDVIKGINIESQFIAN